MSHLDEGTLHALLDGELDQAEQRQIQAHLDHCTACGTRLDDVKNVRKEADRLIGSLDTGEITATAAAPAATTARPAAPPPAPGPDLSSPPMLLLLDPLEVEIRRQRHRKMLAWAATAVLVVGAGWLALEAREQRRIAMINAAEAERPWRTNGVASTADSAAPVLAPEEATTLATADTGSPAAKAEPAPADASPPAPAPTADDEARREELDDAAREAELRELRAAAATAALDRRQREAERRDNERRELERRAAAEAREAPRPVTPAPAPAPPTLEQRAQIYRRIGLDVAKQQLGGPMHVIEGMTPALVGLVQGGNASNMDASRPVVRAVYLDPANRLIILDQQRLREGQSAGIATQLRFVIGDVSIHLHGEPPATVLRNLAARIQ